MEGTSLNVAYPPLQHKEVLAKSKARTPFERQGNTYVMDAFVRIPPGSDLEKQVAAKAGMSSQDFQRPEQR